METENTPHTILVVDDDALSLKVIAAYLKTLGSRILTARDGKSGIESALHEHPDLILLDIMMPEMDGFEVCRRLKAHQATKDIPVIFMTGLTATEHKVKGFQMGAVDCISKPIQEEVVLARISTHLRLREMSQRLQVHERTDELAVITQALHLNQQLEQAIAERAQAESQRDATLEALRESEALLRDIFDGIQDEITLLDRELNIVRTKVWMERMYAADMPLLGKKCHFVYHKRDTPCPWCPALRTIENGQVHTEIVSYPLTEDLSGWIEISTYPVKDDAGHVTGVIEHVKDITEPVRGEEALRESQDRFATFMDHLLAGVFIKDAKGRTLYVNEYVKNVFGIKDWIGKTAWELFSRNAAEVITTNDKKALTEGYQTVIETVPDKDGEARVYQTHRFVINNKTDSASLLGGIALDITERVRAEEALRRHREHLEELIEARTRELEQAQAELIRKERLSTLGRLTATVAHEIRNPLGTVRTAVFAIGDAIKQDEIGRVARALKFAERNIVRCDNIINELLDYTRDRRLHLQPTDVDAWLKAVLDEQSIPGDIACVKELEAGVQVPMDRESLRRAVVNVVENAVHAMQGKDAAPGRPRHELTVSTRVVPSQANSRLEIRVNDTGPGIPEDLQSKVFEPLFSTKRYGVGLGLPIVKNIVEQHGGGIEIESQAGQGTSVILWLPVRSPEN